ncbi:unnamed protein product [Trifolium pratense]|uniref:Uncharacterized protein n=1 Tax=Trifolium pratense TaxID=57577 RepID=A0ACB0LII9_TRIPR|nr:unnamed protein product [Trifolium pratense]
MNLEREDFDLCSIDDEKSGCGLWALLQKEERGCRCCLKIHGSEKSVELKYLIEKNFCYGVEEAKHKQLICNIFY